MEKAFRVSWLPAAPTRQGLQATVLMVRGCSFSFGGVILVDFADSIGFRRKSNAMQKPPAR